MNLTCHGLAKLTDVVHGVCLKNYRKDASEVVQSKVGKNAQSVIISHGMSTEVMTHAMNTNIIGILSCWGAERYIRRSKKRNVS